METKQKTPVKPQNKVQATPSSGDSKKATKGLHPWQVLMGLIFLLAWIVIFISGLLVNSEPYRNVIAGTSTSETQQANLLWSWVVVMFSYTPSNLLVISLFAGMIGAVSRIAKLHITKEGQEEIQSDQTSPIMSGIFRGMFLYLLILTGVVVLDESVLTSPTQEQYAKLAGLVSLFCFLISYDPSKFRALLDRGFNKMNDVGAGGSGGNAG